MYYDRRAGDFALFFFETYLKHTQDQWSGLPFIPALWQAEALQQIYGLYEKPQGPRQLRQVYLEVPKKSGKTELCAGMILLTLFLDESLGCQVYGAAASQKQALNVFRAAHAMVRQSALLNHKFRVLESTHRILRRGEPNSFYAAIAGDGDLSDGCNPSFSCLDELHRWTERKQFENYDVLTKGGITRKDTITVNITTAGTIDKSPLAWRLHNKTIRIQQGIHKDERFYGRIYAADKTDDWTLEATWLKANPSLVGNPGGFVPLSKYRDEYTSALTDRLAQSSFKRYFLNLWDEAGLRAFEPAKWDLCHGDWTNPGLDELLPEQKVRSYPHEFLEKFIGRVCYAGVDLSFSNDMSAVVLLFPNPDGTYDILPFFWVPEADITTRELHDGMGYRDWADSGFIELCPGNAIDYREVKARLLWAAELFNVRMMCFDRFNSREMSTQLIDEGYKCVEVSQGYDGMNEPVKKLLELVNGTQKLRHGGHPILRWNMLCADIEQHYDLVRFVKPERNKSTARIDGLTAAATAMSEAMVEPGPSVYEGRGVVST